MYRVIKSPLVQQSHCLSPPSLVPKIYIPLLLFICCVIFKVSVIGRESACHLQGILPFKGQGILVKEYMIALKSAQC